MIDARLQGIPRITGERWPMELLLDDTSVYDVIYELGQVFELEIHWGQNNAPTLLRIKGRKAT